jgi:hypothetical protein
MNRSAFTISKTAELQTRTAQLAPRPDELCPSTLDASILDDLPPVIKSSATPSANDISSIKRSQLIKLVHAWIYLQANDPDSNSSRNIENILTQRVTPSLLQQIWICDQHYHKLPRFSEFIIKLAHNIPAKDGRFFLFWLRSTDSSTDLVDSLLELANSSQADDIREQFWQTEHLTIRYPLAQAYTDLLFPNIKHSTLREALKEKPLSSLLAALDIVPNTPYLLEFLVKFFTVSDEVRIENNKTIWLYTLNNADESGQLAIIQAFLQKFRLEQKWLNLNRAIGELLDSTELLSQLDHKAKTHFHQWQLIDRINQHIGDQERKQLFYLDFLLQLREIVDWTDDIKIIKMTDFVLADNREEPELLWFVDNNTYQMLAEGEHTDILHFENGREIPTARDISLNHSGENIVRLKLDEVNILYARDFIRQRLKKAKQ